MAESRFSLSRNSLENLEGIGETLDGSVAISFMDCQPTIRLLPARTSYSWAILQVGISNTLEKIPRGTEFALADVRNCERVTSLRRLPHGTNRFKQLDGSIVREYGCIILALFNQEEGEPSFSGRFRNHIFRQPSNSNR